MQYLQIQTTDLITELISENRKMALEAATLRAGISDIKNKCAKLDSEIHGNPTTQSSEE